MSKYVDLMTINRRQLICGMSALGGSLLLGNVARAEQAECIVSTWGGDFEKLLKGLVAPLVLSQGITTQWDIGLHGPRKAKLTAERRLPKGTLDVVSLQDSDAYEMSQLNIFEDLDESKVPNIANVTPALKRSYSIPHVYSGMVIVYNPEHLEPKGFNDLWNDKLAGKLGLLDPLFDRNLCFATLAAGQSLNSYEAGKSKLLELKKLKPRFYSSQETAAQALQSGEIWALPTWRARAVQWQKAGLPVKNVVPAEGIIPICYEASIPKNAPNKKAAYAFLNAMLAPEAQSGFANGMGYAPVTSNSGIEADLAKTISFSAEEQKNIKAIDADYVSKNSQSLRQWWDREFLA